MKAAEFAPLIDHKASSLEKAIALLWWSTRYNSCNTLSAAEIVSLFKSQAIGNPNQSRLREELKKSPFTITTQSGHTLNLRGLAHCDELYIAKTGETPRMLVVSDELLPSVIWRDSRQYLERVAVQINGSFSNGFYDAALVMIRRLVETLLIESFEHKQVQDRIKGQDGHYLMLSAIATVASSDTTLNLSRETVNGLKLAKLRGDRAAHNRRVNANRKDVEDLREPLGTIVKELLVVSGIK